MNVLDKFIELVVPYMISILEIIGIFVVFASGIHGIWECFQNVFMKKHYNLQSDLAKGLAMGLEFKMAAEILKTVLIQSMEELYMLGAVILIRALLSLLIHYELKQPKKTKEEATANAAAEEKSETKE